MLISTFIRLIPVIDTTHFRQVIRYRDFLVDTKLFDPEWMRIKNLVITLCFAQEYNQPIRLGLVLRSQSGTKRDKSCMKHNDITKNLSYAFYAKSLFIHTSVTGPIRGSWQYLFAVVNHLKYFLRYFCFEHAWHISWYVETGMDNDDRGSVTGNHRIVLDNTLSGYDRLVYCGFTYTMCANCITSNGIIIMINFYLFSFVCALTSQAV